MGEGNGNGQHVVEIDVTNDEAFRAGVVQYFQLLVDRTQDLPAIKKKVERHETIVKFGKWLSVPGLGLLHAAFEYAKSYVFNKGH